MKKYAAIAVFLLLAALAIVVVKSGSTSSSGSASSGSTSTDAAMVVGDYAEDVHYRLAGESSKPESETILVQEFFWYGCPHCQAFEPAVRDYKSKLVDDVELVQIPVTWNEATGLHAAMHYVAMESDNPQALQDDLFEKIISIRKEGNLEKHIDELEPVFAAHGISASDFRGGLLAPDVQSKVSSAAALMRAAGINGTPSIMVDGTWVVLNNEAVAGVGPFSVVDHLVKMARQAR